MKGLKVGATKPGLLRGKATLLPLPHTISCRPPSGTTSVQHRDISPDRNPLRTSIAHACWFPTAIESAGDRISISRCLIFDAARHFFILDGSAGRVHDHAAYKKLLRATRAHQANGLLQKAASCDAGHPRHIMPQLAREYHDAAPVTGRPALAHGDISQDFHNGPCTAGGVSSDTYNRCRV